ncbi:Methyl-accepting chemotaxis protein [hydrothermal vent metagenome]|uniref:Methyl-accepting chemotaxis protein n=1 Tax=hydrothermal vent metagenome TaxID=652676 RepID=A0A1W1BA97_9ZZZZ
MSRTNPEIKCAYQEVIISRTDIEGNIIYCNSTFSKINGFKGASVINQPHNIVRHPDMPKTIFRIIWKIILDGLPIQAIIKNKTNDNKYYWSMIEWKPQRDNQNNIVSFVAEGRQAPEQIIKIIEPLYQMLSEIEKEHGMDSALRYLHSYLDEKGMTYSQYLNHLTKHRGMRCLCEFIRHSIFQR